MLDDAVQRTATLRVRARRLHGQLGEHGQSLVPPRRDVLWPRARTFVIRAKASPASAIAEMASSLRRREVERASALARQLAPFWAQLVPREKSARFLERSLAVAERLGNPELAAVLVTPFLLNQLTPRAASRLVALAQRYGLEWCRHVLDAWSADRRRADGGWRKTSWSLSVPAVCRQLCAGESTEGLAVARWIITEEWTRTMTQWATLRQEGPRLVRTGVEDLSAPILALLESSVIAKCPELHAQIIGTLASPESDYPIGGLTQLLRTAHEAHGGTALRKLRLCALHEHCREALATRLATPARDKDDWSIAAPRRCSCGLCATLVEFLAAADRVRFEWPLAKDQRAHIHRAVEMADVPVSHVTRRMGRPFTLVLAKTPDLFARDGAERNTWERDLTWLTRTARAF